MSKRKIEADPGTNIKPPNGYTYFAFISYKHENKKAAKIHYALQAYRLPKELRDKYPDRITPIFRDRDHLQHGQLNERLKEALKDSDNLIVMCSRLAHDEPYYINQEIEEFCNTHSEAEKRIIPIIIDRSKKPEKECYPEKLQRICKGDSLKGLNLYSEGFHRVILKTVAGILKLKTVEELESFDKRRRKKRRWIAGMAAALLLLVALFVGYRAYRYYAPQKAYFADYTTVYGVPQGIWPVSRRERTQMAEHYTIITQRGAVRELRHENVKGFLIKHSDPEQADRPTKATYEYTEDGVLEKVTYFNMWDQQVLVLEYSSDGRIVDLKGSRSENDYSDYDYQPAPLVITQETAVGASIKQVVGWVDDTYMATTVRGASTSIVRYLQDYTEEGFLKEIRYASEPLTNTAAQDKWGRYGVRYQYNALGQVVSERVLSCSGKGVSASNHEAYSLGVMSGGIRGRDYRYEYAGGCLTVTCSYVDAQGEPVLNQSKWAVRIREYDEYYNPVRETFFGKDLLPLRQGLVYSTTYEYADGFLVRASMTDQYNTLVVSLDYDPIFGFESREEYRDVSGRALRCGDGYSIGIVRYDTLGRRKRSEYFDCEGRRCPSKNRAAMGASIVEEEYDKNGYPVVVKLYDAYEQPMAVAEQRSIYSQDGKVRELWHYNKNGKLCLNAEGYAGVVFEYDERGNKVLETYYGTDGSIHACSKGYAIREMEYDDCGHRTRVIYRDASGALIDSVSAVLDATYDSFGYVTGLTTRGQNGEVFLQIEYQYNECGNEVSRLVDFELWQESCVDYRDYDDFGNLEKVYSLDDDGKKIVSELYVYGDERYYIVEYISVGLLKMSTYDYYGNTQATTYTDGFKMDSELVTGPEGYAEVVREILDENNTLWSYLDPDGSPILMKNGYAYTKIESDLRGNITRISFFGTGMEPVNCIDGYNSVSMAYDLNNQLTEMHYYDSDGKDVTLDVLFED